MDIQSITVWLIIAAAAFAAARWLWRIVCSLRHGGTGGCVSCGKEDCPLKSLKSRK